MRRQLLYLIGEPGCGKSTLLAEITRGLYPVELRPARFVTVTEWHDTAAGQCRYAELGRRRPIFSGTDALGMSALPHAARWVATSTYPRIVAEGDRLAHPRFWLAAQAAGYVVTVAALVVDEEEAARRREARGSRQDERWLKGRRTRLANLRGQWPVVDVDATRPAAELAYELAV